MHLMKTFIVLTSLTLLASCGGSSNSDSDTSSEPNLFRIENVTTERFSSNRLFTLDEFLSGSISNNGNVSETFYSYDVDDNVSEIRTFDEDGDFLTTEVFDYTYNANQQIINRESIFTGSFDNDLITVTLIDNLTWVNNVPQSLTYQSEVINLINNVTTTSHNTVNYEVNLQGRVTNTFIVGDDEAFISSESEFSSDNDEIRRVAFDTFTFNGAVTEIQDFIYDDVNDTTTVTITTINSDLTLSTKVEIYVYDTESNITSVVIFDGEELNNGNLNNVEVLTYTYVATESCGDYSDMENVAFDTLVPTCIGN